MQDQALAYPRATNLNSSVLYPDLGPALCMKVPNSLSRASAKGKGLLRQSSGVPQLYPDPVGFVDAATCTPGRLHLKAYFIIPSLSSPCASYSYCQTLLAQVQSGAPFLESLSTELDKQLDELLRTRMSDLFSTSAASDMQRGDQEKELLIGLGRAEFDTACRVLYSVTAPAENGIKKSLNFAQKRFAVMRSPCSSVSCGRHIRKRTAQGKGR
jgi:hypothetical protein